MRLSSFRVQMYKSILDSGWVDITALMVIVGKNESGKTSLLKALHKLNPFKPEPYQIHREWPRGRRRNQNDRQVVCTGRFELAPDEAEELGAIAGHQLPRAFVEISRDYGGRLEVTFPDGLCPDRLHPNEVDQASEALPSVPETLGDAFKKAADSCRSERVRRAHEGRYSELTSLATEQSALLNQSLSTQRDSRKKRSGISTWRRCRRYSKNIPNEVADHKEFHAKYLRACDGVGAPAPQHERERLVREGIELQRTGMTLDEAFAARRCGSLGSTTITCSASSCTAAAAWTCASSSRGWNGAGSRGASTTTSLR